VSFSIKERERRKGKERKKISNNRKPAGETCALYLKW